MRGHASVVVMVVLLSGCDGPPEPSGTADPAAEQAAVERTLTTWFDSGLARGDTGRVGRCLTPRFQILEDSVWYDRDGFLRFVASLHEGSGGPFTITYTLSDWRTRVSGDVAWASLRNHADVTPANGDPFALDWRETAVLMKQEGSWLIDRYHSASVR